LAPQRVLARIGPVLRGCVRFISSVPWLPESWPRPSP
jgi:hypothetical protein